MLGGLLQLEVKALSGLWVLGRIGADFTPVVCMTGSVKRAATAKKKWG